MAMLKKITSLIDRGSSILGHGVSWLTLIMMLATAALVLLRYGFNIGSLITQDAIMYLHVVVFMLAMAITLKNNGHVRVDIFYQNFSPRKKALVDLAGSLFLLLPFCLFMFVVSFNYVIASWQTLEVSPDSGLPLYLIKSLLLLLPVSLALQGISEGLKALLLLTQNKDVIAQQEEHSHG